MKLLIFSHDESIISLAQDLENLEWASCANAKEAQEFLSQWQDEDKNEAEVDDLIVCLLDFAVGLKQIDEFSQKNIKNKWLIRIGIAPGESLKELRQHQKSKTAAHGYLVKPINVSALESMINDQETALFVQKNNLLDEGTQIGEIKLTKLESKAVKELDNLDEDKEDYDVTHPSMVIPSSLHEAQIPTAEFSDVPTFQDDPLHQQIQKVFDRLFTKDEKKKGSDESGLLVLSADTEDSSDNELFSQNNDEIPQETLRDEEAMSDNNEDGFDLEFDMNDEMTQESELDHDFDDEASSTEDSTDLGFSFDDENEATENLDVELSEAAPKDSTESHGEEDGFDLSFDDDESGSSESLSVSIEREEFTQTVIDQDDGALDFGDDEDDKSLSFSLGGAQDSSLEQEQEHEQEQEIREDSYSTASVEDFGSLDFDESENDADPTVLATSMDSLQPDPEESVSENIGEDTLEKVDQTISEIVLGDVEEANAQRLSDEDSTGEFDLPAGLPEELTNDLVEEEVQFSEEVHSSQDSTNPTVLTSSEDLHKALADDLVEETTDELDFSPLEASQSDKVQYSEEPVSAPSRVLSNVPDDELLRLQSTIRQLREEREEHLKEIQELKKEVKLVEQDGLSTRAELDEAKIEISILKKRHKTEIEEFRYQLKLSDECKQIFEERCKNYQKEFDRLNQKVRIEFNQVKQREKELESQLELVTMDTEAQVQARDGKILELKRKIDALEFNMENATIREQKSRDDKMRLEERLHKIMTTLRGSIKVLEDDDLSSSTSLDEEKQESDSEGSGRKDKL